MEIICQNCDHSIKNENINVEKDYAFCISCQNVFKISDLLDKYDELKLSKEILNNPPKGTWKYEDFEKTIIGSTTRSPIAFFLVPFMAVWTGGSIGGIYITQIVNGKFDLFTSLFGIPFIIGSVIFWSIALMAIGGKVEVVIGAESYIFTGIGRIGIKRKFDWNSIVRIYEEHSKGNWPFSFNRYSSSIFLEGKTRIKFGYGLKEERKYFLLNALRYFRNRKK